MKRRAYIASPLGFTAAGRDHYARTLLPALTAHVDPIDPWAVPFTTREEVGRRNARDIRECDLVIAILEGQELDAGTAAEVGYAAALEKPIHALRTDLRRHGEDGGAVNLQVEAFVAETGGRIHTTLDDLLAAL